MMWYTKLGGRKFISVILVSLVMFTTLIWTFIMKSAEAWTYLNSVTTIYHLFLAAYAGLQIWQKIKRPDISEPVEEKEDNNNKSLLTD